MTFDETSLISKKNIDKSIEEICGQTGRETVCGLTVDSLCAVPNE